MKMKHLECFKNSQPFGRNNCKIWIQFGNLLFTSTFIHSFNELPLKGSVRSPAWLCAGTIWDDDDPVPDYSPDSWFLKPTWLCEVLGKGSEAGLEC